MILFVIAEIVYKCKKYNNIRKTNRSLNDECKLIK